MTEIEAHRKLLLSRQTELRRVMAKPDRHDEAIRLFFRQHAGLHAAEMAQGEDWSYQDEILEDMDEGSIRRVPQNHEHSVAWCLWHIARIEDVAMNLLVAGCPQVFVQDSWQRQLNTKVHHTGNAMSREAAARLSAGIDLDALRAYRVAVGRRTREIVRQLDPESMKRKVAPERLQQVWEQEAVVKAASGIVDYWSRRTIAGLLLMPATRHSLVHLNEALKLRGRRT